MERTVPVRVFFSFDFTEDLWRASVVRNRWIADPSLSGGGFWDPRFASEHPPSGADLEQFVEDQIQQSDLTVVLIGRRTSSCPHVLHAISRSAELGHGLLGIHVEQCKDRYGSPGVRGRNPLHDMIVNQDGREVPLSDLVPIHDWVDEDGFTNLPDWVDEAMERAAAD
jgi:hypothetical protein